MGNPFLSKSSREPVVISRELISQISPVASKELISSNSGKNDGNALACQSCDKIRGDKCGICDWFIQVPYHRGEELADIGPDYDFMVIRCKRFCDDSGVRQFIVETISTLETYRVCFDWLIY